MYTIYLCHLGSFGIGEVSIDTALGSELAQEAGALNDSEGVPNLRVYDGVDTHGTPIMTGIYFLSTIVYVH